MQLPASIRRGIKRLGGLKVFLAEEFRVEGDNVSLREVSPAFQDVSFSEGWYFKPSVYFFLN